MVVIELLFAREEYLPLTGIKARGSVIAENLDPKVEWSFQEGFYIVDKNFKRTKAAAFCEIAMAIPGPIERISMTSGGGRVQFRRALAIIFVAVVLLPSLAFALDPAKAITQYVQSNWTGESGLPQNSVHAIAQTTDGYIWFGTEEGLTRFDGVQFTTFAHLNYPGLASDYIQALAAGSGGTLWIGTDSGLIHYDPGYGFGGHSFTAITTKEGLSSNNVTSLCKGPNGELWVGTTTGLDRVSHGRVQTLRLGKGTAQVTVNALIIDSDGALWVGTNAGLFRFYHHHLLWFGTSNGLPGERIVALASAPHGIVWVGTQAHGIAEIDRGHISTLRQPLPSKDIDGLLVDRDGALWIAFDRHGIGRLYDGRLSLYDHSRGLPSNRCTRALFEDREGNLWIGLLDAGAVQLRDGKFSVIGKPEGLSGNYIGNVLQAKDGSMWIGADSDGLDHLLPNGRVEIWNWRIGLPHSAVYSLLQTRDGSIWVGYRNGALARIRNRVVSVYYDPQARGVSLNALFEDREGNLWVGTYGKGLARFEDGRFVHFSHTGGIVDIVQATDGALWIALEDRGVERIFRGTVTRYSRGNGLPSNHVMCLYADVDGSIWVGTASGGLSLVRNGRITSWTPKQGLPESTVGSILEDNSGYLWAGGDKGIFRISRDELIRSADSGSPQIHAELYGSADGMRSREMVYGSMPCAWKSRDGRLWFATIRGVAVINPAHVVTDTIVPPVWITRADFDSHSVRLQNGIHVGRGSGNLEISYTAPSFVAPDQVHFRYRLLGFDSNWISAGARRIAWYTNLPPGHYTFTAQAENSDGLWNRTGASFAFVLEPPLTQTWYAYLAYGLLALLFTWGAFALRTRSLIRRQRELTQIVAERTSQLESEKAALEAARRELQVRATHDSLTGVFNRAAIVEHLEREIARATREKYPLGIVIADLDHFKRFNDRFGHLCGDDIIRETTDRFRSALRDYDLVGRYGGEEFLLLFPGLDLATVPGRVDDLRDAIRSSPFVVADEEIRVTCSFGVATFRPESDQPTIRDLLHRADTALYVAKNSGRDCVSFEAHICR